MSQNKINYKKETIVNTVANIFYLFALWLMTLITPRISGLDDAGIFTIALSVSNICTAISTYSINFFVSSDMEHKYNEQHYLYFSFTSTFLSLLVSIIIALAFGYHLQPITFMAVIFYYIYKCAENVTLIVSANMQRVGKLYLSGYALIIKAVVSLGLFALTLFLSKNIALAFGVLAIFAVLYFIFVDFQLLRKYTGINLKISKASYKIALMLFVVAFPVFLYGASFAAVVSYPRLVLEKYVGKDVLGFFGTMSAISSLIQSALSAILIPFIPKIVEHYKNKDYKSLFKLLAYFALFILAMTGVAFLCACFLDKWLMGIICPGEQYKEIIEQYSKYFKWIILSIGVQALTVLANISLISIRKLLMVGISSIIGTASMFLTVYLLIPKYQVKGTIISYLISYGLFFLLAVLFFIYSIYKNKKEIIKEQ